MMIDLKKMIVVNEIFENLLKGDNSYDLRKIT